MEDLILFSKSHGLVLGLIALIGVIILGTLKYCKVFEKISNETIRHNTYIIISVGLSLVGTLIYLLHIEAWSWAYFINIAAVIWAINQGFYNIFKTTKLSDLVKKIADWLVEKIKSSATKKDIDEE